MAGRKQSFVVKDTEGDKVVDTIAAATDPGKRKPRKTYTEEETREALESMQSSGRKGVKLPRFNVAFTPSNYEFIRIMSQVRGQTLTEFINDVVKDSRERNSAIYKKAIEFRNSLK